MRFAKPDDWLSWLEGLHPQAIDLGLERVAEVWRRMGLQLQPARVISVAGTNGKGSSLALLESIYRAAGYRVGAYSSPHLLIYNERIRLDGRLVEDAELCAAFARVDQARLDQARGEISLTYFEFGTLAALALFAEAGLDLIILEVGLGGRLDAVNIIDADVALISSIDFDHQDWLGTDLDQIAREKGGIMRPGRPAVFNGDCPPAGLLQLAAELGARLHLRQRDYRQQRLQGGWSWQAGSAVYPHLPLPALRGPHQLHNAGAVLMLVELLQSQLPVAEAAIVEGLQRVFVAGRIQLIPGAVELVLDVAHNPEGARALAAALLQMPQQGRNLAVFGLLQDKDAEQVVAPLLALVDSWYLGRPASPRGREPASLAPILQRLGAEVFCHDSLVQAYHQCRAQAQPGDRILVFGSFYTVSEVMSLL
ncbi:MAG: bifunctional tetrahydrofolate synthase/dihydrofolate synthase [Gammaproteobacteria bacterium]|nr:bifunctional tetrahydrofolate synthase/dihydrofolate synthase [Gammaproteobacteria bacterium]